MNYEKQGASKIVKPIDSDIMEDELNRVIADIAKALVDRGKELERKIELTNALKDSLDKYAEIAELKIKRQEVRSLKLRVYKILRSSTNKLLIAAMDGGN